MTDIVTSGGISALLNETKEAVQLQVLDLSMMDGGAKRFKATLWDGESKQACVISPDLTKDAQAAGLEELGVLRIEEFNLVKLGDSTKVTVLTGSVVETKLESKVKAGQQDGNKENKRLSFSSPPSAAKTSTQRTSNNTRRVQPIGALNPYAPNWTIKARVTNRQEVRQFSGRDGRSGGKVFSVDLMDEDGSEIKATMWHEMVDKYLNAFQVGKMYFISKGRLKVANKQYSAGDYDMTISEQTEVEEVPEEETTPVRMHYSFVPFDSLAAQIGSRTPFDVLGVVTACGQLGSVKRKTDGTDLARRDVTLLDSTSKSVRLTVWNQFASETLRDLPDMVGRGDTVVLAAKGVRASDFDGVSLSTIGRSVLTLDPAGEPACEALRRWYDNEGGKAAPSVSAGAGLATARGSPGQGGRAGGAVIGLKDMQPQELSPKESPPEFFEGRVTMSRFSSKRDGSSVMWYPACPQEGCNKKVVQEHGGWYCEGHQQAFPSCKHRYVTQVQVVDTTGSAWVALFNEGAEAIMGGRTADELVEMKESNERAFQALLKERQFHPFAVRIKSKTEEYMGESRRRLTAVNVHPMDWSSESKRLLKEIEAMS